MTARSALNLCLVLSLILNAASGDIRAQVGIGTSNVSPSAILEVKSSSKGLLLPRLTTTQRDAIVSPELGLLIYNSTTGRFQGYNDGSRLNQENEITNLFQYSNDNWQSFTPSISGKLDRITFYAGSVNPSPFTVSLKIYSGEGISGTLLGTLSPLPFSTEGDLRSYDLSSLSITLVAGDKYTFRIETSNGSALTYMYSIADLYPRGRCSTDDYEDLRFGVYLRYNDWSDLH